MISSWKISLPLAVLIHFSFAHFILAENKADPAGANAAGDGGLEVGLGSAGSYTALVEKQAAKKRDEVKKSELKKEPKKVTPKKPEPVKAKAKAKPKPKPIPKAKPVKKAPLVKPKIISSTAASPKFTVAKSNELPIAKDQPIEAPAKGTEPNSDVQQKDNTADTKSKQALRRASGSGSNHQRGGKVGNARDYFKLLDIWLARFQEYPIEAKKQKKQGIVKLQFTIDREGNVLASSVKKSSGHNAIDQAALKMLQAANPVPPLPRSIKGEKITLVKPIEYSLITNNTQR